jgi:hypothetical protein
MTNNPTKFLSRWLIGFALLTHGEEIVSALRASLPRDGLYFLPRMDLKAACRGWYCRS